MKVCIWCGCDVREERVFHSLFCRQQAAICLTCQHLFDELSLDHRCKGCGRLWDKSGECYDCLRWRQKLGTSFLPNQALFVYDERAKEFMERYKFLGDCQVAQLVSKALRNRFSPLLAQGYVLCPLPSSASSLKKREFESVAYLLDCAKIPYESLLSHIGDGQKQSEKTRYQRLCLKQPFAVLEQLSYPSKVVLFDDVYTTGTTIRLAAKCLQSKGISLQLWTLFR